MCVHFTNNCQWPAWGCFLGHTQVIPDSRLWLDSCCCRCPLNPNRKIIKLDVSPHFTLLWDFVDHHFVESLATLTATVKWKNVGYPLKEYPTFVAAGTYYIWVFSRVFVEILREQTAWGPLRLHGTGTTDLDFSKFMEAWRVFGRCRTLEKHPWVFCFCCCLFLLQHFKVPKF